MDTRLRRIGRIILMIAPVGLLALGALLTTKKHETPPHETLTRETTEKLPGEKPEKPLEDKPAVQPNLIVQPNPNLIVQMPKRWQPQVREPARNETVAEDKIAADEPLPHRTSNDELIEQADMMIQDAHRGSRLEQHRMIRQARHVYQSLIGSGDKRAAIRLGRTYDPAWIKKFALRIYPDKEQAIYWYRWGGHPNGRD